MAGVTRASRFGAVSDYATRAAEELCLIVQVTDGVDEPTSTATIFVIVIATSVKKMLRSSELVGLSTVMPFAQSIAAIVRTFAGVSSSALPAPDVMRPRMRLVAEMFCSFA